MGPLSDTAAGLTPPRGRPVAAQRASAPRASASGRPRLGSGARLAAPPPGERLEHPLDARVVDDHSRAPLAVAAADAVALPIAQRIGLVSGCHGPTLSHAPAETGLP